MVPLLTVLHQRVVEAAVELQPQVLKRLARLVTLAVILQLKAMQVVMALLLLITMVLVVAVLLLLEQQPLQLAVQVERELHHL